MASSLRLIRGSVAALLVFLAACNNPSSSNNNSGDTSTLGLPPGAPSNTKPLDPAQLTPKTSDATANVWYRHCDPVGCHANQPGLACDPSATIGSICGTKGNTCVYNSCGDTLVCGIDDNQVNCKN